MTSKLPTTMRLREGEVVYLTRKIEAHVACIRSSEDFYRLLHAMDAHARAAESVWAVLLDARHKVVGVHECARGGVVGVQVTPCEVFRAAVIAGSPAIILAHNHPSGLCSPSADDFTFTSRVQVAGELLGIEVLDHVIVAAERSYFFLDAGHIKTAASPARLTRELSADKPYGRVATCSPGGPPAYSDRKSFIVRSSRRATEPGV